jgi:hypothetical protein
MYNKTQLIFIQNSIRSSAALSHFLNVAEVFVRKTETCYFFKN